MRDRRQESAVALLSGGLDSAVSLAEAMRKVRVLEALTFRYGQKAADAEVRAARRVAKALGVEHRVISLPWLGRLRSGALLDPETDVPTIRVSDLGSKAGRSASRTVWVPNRNGLFVNIAGSVAEARGADLIVAGFNREEAANFPDNGPEFVRAVNRSLRWSTLSRVGVVSYVRGMTKEEIVLRGVLLGAPIDKIYSCYRGGPRHCGTCESCRRVARAFRAAGHWGLVESRFEH